MNNNKRVGLGLRRSMLDELNQYGVPNEIDFFEVAPENWIRTGLSFKKFFEEFSQEQTIFCHGLSLSIGSYLPVDMEFLSDIKCFLLQYDIEFYSEHLSYCSGQGQYYDLLPIPFTEEAVLHVSQKIKQVQDFLERPLILENVTYYARPYSEMSEIEFLQAILSETQCLLLLDVNNVYVNSVNHNYDPYEFLNSFDKKHIGYMHIAGHLDTQKELLIDTHGSEIIRSVFDLCHYAYQRYGVFPTLLERDSNIPETIYDLIQEINHIRALQNSVEQEKILAVV